MISRPFIERPIATSLLLLGLFVAGVAAFQLLPVAALPQVDFPTITVTATLPGADPETMASSVATPLERQFAQIQGLGQMTSVSALGSTQVTLQFALDRPIDSAAQDVQTAINAAGGQLPKTLPNPPTYRKTNPAEAPILILGLTSPTLPLIKVDDYADSVLAQRLSQIEGVATVTILGEQKPAIRIQVNPAAAAAMGLTLDDLRTRIAAATIDSPKGTLDGPTRAFAIDANDQLMDPKGWKSLVVATHTGAAVQLGDLGQVIEAPENNKLAGWLNDARSVVLAIQRQPGANVITTVDRIMAALPALQAIAPASVKVQVISDRTQTIRASVADVEFTLCLTILLVVAVIFLFLRSIRATLIPGAAVPLSLIATFAGMDALGYSLDNLSLMALTIAAGFVVDDAIVMIENIVRHLEAGKRPREAALAGSAQIGFTIVSITGSLIAVFIPLLAMGGIVGRLFREFAVTVTIALVMSAIISLTLTPTLCAQFLKPERGARHGRLYQWLEAGFDRLLSGYKSALGWSLGHRPIVLGLFVAMVVASGALFAIIPKGFFPQQDTGFLFATTEAAQDISFAAMAEHQQAVAAIVRRDPAVQSVASGIGSGGAQALNTGRLYITLKPRSQRDVTVDQVIQRLRPQVAEVPGIAVFMQAAQDINVGGRLARTQYQYTLQDPDVAELDRWAVKLQDVLRGLPGLTDVASDLEAASPRTAVAIDRVTAARLGIAPQAIDDALYDAFGQRQVATTFTQLNQYHVILEVAPSFQLGPSALQAIYVRAGDGSLVPLSAISRIATTTGPQTINHQGQFPAVTLSFNLAPGTSLGTAVQRIQAAEARLGKPVTLATSFQGTAQAFQSSLASEPYLIAAALLVVYIVLGILYESYIHPLTILSTLPPAGVGALLTLLLFGMDLSVIGLVGIILLIGIVKKNGIMMVDFAIEAERDRGLGPEQAITEACLLRFRPIMMTTMAAIMGGLPLALGGGTGSELRQPLGYAIVGGLILSQLVTLLTTPVVYLAFDSLVRDRARVREPAAEAML